MTRDETITAFMRGEGCLGRSQNDEPVFVLVARDRHASSVVRRWAEMTAHFDGASAKTDEALKIADQMDEWRKGREIPAPVQNPVDLAKAEIGRVMTGLALELPEAVHRDATERVYLAVEKIEYELHLIAASLVGQWNAEADRADELASEVHHMPEYEALTRSYQARSKTLRENAARLRDALR